MKKWIVLILLLTSFSIKAQTFEILSEVRPVIEITINGKLAHVLVDTGSTLNIIDSRYMKQFGLKKGKYIGCIEGNNKLSFWRLKNCTVSLLGYEYCQFGISDIESICDGVFNDTGIEVVGILGITALKQLGLVIDFKNNTIYRDNLVSNN